jgi:hypothetical protein
VGIELVHADGRKEGRTGITELIVAFGNFANALKSNKNSETESNPRQANTSISYYDNTAIEKQALVRITNWQLAHILDGLK